MGSLRHDHIARWRSSAVHGSTDGYRPAKPVIRQAETERGAEECAAPIVDDSVPKKGPYRCQGVDLHHLGPPARRACRNYLLPPRTTAPQRAAISSPPQALFVFQTNGTPGLYYYLTLRSGLRARVCDALPTGFGPRARARKTRGRAR